MYIQHFKIKLSLLSSSTFQVSSVQKILSFVPKDIISITWKGNVSILKATVTSSIWICYSVLTCFPQVYRNGASLFSSRTFSFNLIKALSTDNVIYKHIIPKYVTNQHSFNEYCNIVTCSMCEWNLENKCYLRRQQV